jgi:hypothetical protein
MAIRQDLPADFAGIVRGENVTRDFLTWKGTALSPPLVMLLAQVLLTVYAVRGERMKTSGVAGLAVLGVLYTLGMLGERILLRVFKPATFDPVPAIVVAANVVLPSLMATFASFELRRR